ncbi:phosphodiesterase [Taklimakanibacter lacteus]|uniref:phosphodiesterase n=1 Tax=Taklimakanibacter lacteus TaxID=2268456 RepID=UPI000E662DD5
MTANALKIIQLSDAHLAPPPGLVQGGDPVSKLKAAIADINAHHGDAALVIISGDLANDGERPAYEALAEALGDLVPPFRLIPGNHDDRRLMAEMFPQGAVMTDGFVQSAMATPQGVLLLIDTLDEGQIGGRLDAARLGFIARELERARSQPAYIFMHHPPFMLHMAEFDALPLAGAEALRDLVLAHGQVRHIFAGHVHRFIAGSWHGVPVSITRSTSHQTALQFGTGWQLGPERPGYAIIFIDAAGAIVHFHELAG